MSLLAIFLCLMFRFWGSMSDIVFLHIEILGVDHHFWMLVSDGNLSTCMILIFTQVLDFCLLLVGNLALWLQNTNLASSNFATICHLYCYYFCSMSDIDVKSKISKIKPVFYTFDWCKNNPFWKQRFAALIPMRVIT